MKQDRRQKAGTGEKTTATEKACEKTFCRWGAECVSLGGGRAHCACPARCPATAAPVCSTGGRTHRNHCYLRKEACERRLNLRVKHEGECGLDLKLPSRLRSSAGWGRLTNIVINTITTVRDRCLNVFLEVRNFWYNLGQTWYFLV
ncbi:Follistatin-related protein 4 [Eumeta japonica]|uniref:Follistatin-related protein 4 n=1 Tax=Eumeta variegata TaxID=151549 RepID=A0A4C1TLU7_EUMVA|nr:Follistatin-related protein 4 [Eumeta japonica]